jgi:hypothetical protein
LEVEVDSERKKHLLRILRSANLDPTHWLEQSERYGTPILEKALFLREAWAPVLRKGDTSWVERSIAELESRVGRKDLYALRFLPERPDTLAALQHVKQSSVDLAAVSHLVRESQLSVLSRLISIIDGGHCFEDGLSSDWILCASEEDGDPGQSFGDMKDYLWDFDPDRAES